MFLCIFTGCQLRQYHTLKQLMFHQCLLSLATCFPLLNILPSLFHTLSHFGFACLQLLHSSNHIFQAITLAFASSARVLMLYSPKQRRCPPLLSATEIPLSNLPTLLTNNLQLSCVNFQPQKWWQQRCEIPHLHGGLPLRHPSTFPGFAALAHPMPPLSREKTVPLLQAFQEVET